VNGASPTLNAQVRSRAAHSASHQAHPFHRQLEASSSGAMPFHHNNQQQFSLAAGLGQAAQLGSLASPHGNLRYAGAAHCACLRAH